MFNISYETTPCRDYQLKDIFHKIQLNMVDGNLIFSDSLKNSKISGILLVTPEAKDVPIFAHPLEVSLSGRNVVAVDARGWLKSERSGGYRVSNSLDSQLALIRAKLNEHWITESKRDLLNAGTLPLTVFVRWISSSITQRLSLTPEQQIILSIVSGLYYQSLFDEEVIVLDEDMKTKRASLISRATSIPTTKILEVLDNIEDNGGELTFRSVRDLVNMFALATQSIRLENVNVALLYTILSGSWFGANSKEIVTVALEHPPTFLALVYQAVNERGYRKARLAEYTERSNKQDLGKSFTYNVASLLKG